MAMGKLTHIIFEAKKFATGLNWIDCKLYYRSHSAGHANNLWNASNLWNANNLWNLALQIF